MGLKFLQSLVKHLLVLTHQAGASRCECAGGRLPAGVGGGAVGGGAAAAPAGSRSMLEAPSLRTLAPGSQTW